MAAEPQSRAKLEASVHDDTDDDDELEELLAEVRDTTVHHKHTHSKSALLSLSRANDATIKQWQLQSGAPSEQDLLMLFVRLTCSMVPQSGMLQRQPSQR